MAGAGMAAALICSLAACTGPEAEWAAEAEQYFADIHVSWNSGFANLGTFFAPEATIDTHTLTGRPLAVGRTAGVADLREHYQGDDLHARAEEPIYLSADGAIDPSRHYFPFGLTDVAVPQAPVYEFAGTFGATRMTWTGSKQSGQTIVGLRPDPVDRVVEDYLRVWTDPGQPNPGIYAAGAVLRDTLHEVSLTGSQISEAAAAGRAPLGLRGASLREIPDGEGPAVYALHNPCVADQPLDHGGAPARPSWRRGLPAPRRSHALAGCRGPDHPGGALPPRRLGTFLPGHEGPSERVVAVADPAGSGGDRHGGRRRERDHRVERHPPA